MSSPKGLVLASLGLLSLITLLAVSCQRNAPVAPPPPTLRASAPSCGPVTFTIDQKSSLPPSDIQGGATSASLQDAAVFAWQEFIALNWPAVTQNGQPNTRDQPDQTAIFGSTSGPLVWHTYRHKVEIFPGMGAPHGYPSPTPSPTASPTASPYYGYDDLPQYIYANGQIPSFASLIGSPTPTPGPTPWINLDETSEIGLDTMFAGTLTSASPTPPPFPGQEILFLAKANRAEYNYVAANQYWIQNNVPSAATANYIGSIANNPQAYVDPPPGSTTYVSFPTNTIEVKSAWRQLTAAEANSGRFYQTTVRFYNATSSGQVGYIDAVWGLVALHIIQKTQTAPYFIYATFSQADNILDSNGNCTEDEQGNLRLGPCVTPSPSQSPSPSPSPTPSVSPLDPNVTSTPATSATPQTPQTVQQFQPATSSLNLQAVGQRVFYINTVTTPPPPPTTQGMIAVNEREHLIPQCIIDVNAAVHAAITTYGQQNNNNNPVWQYYKLINVQYQPYDKPAGIVYTGTSPDPATYYQANEVVETNYNLQVFSGQFQGTLPPPNAAANINNLITDYNSDGTPFHNVFYNLPPASPSATPTPNSGKAANMGGCMGCHGNAQVAGFDFSFILKGGRVEAPGVATGPTGAGSATEIKKFRKLFSR